MTFPMWFTLVGVLFVFMALTSTVLRRLPLSSAMLYLGAGAALAALGAIDFDPLAGSAFLERITEVAVIISLFTAGLKLRAPLTERRWGAPLRLALGAMTLTVGLIALLGVVGLGLPLGAAVLLGAVLAPTDPVLASDVQVREPGDQDRLRFSLTGEAGLNDGAAFPFVMLGLGLLGLHEIGAWGWRWLAVDVVWAIGGGLAIGGLLGMLVGQLVLFLRRNYKEAVGLDDFLSLGLVASSYGIALLAHTYGFLAVFAAGVALRRVEQSSNRGQPPEELKGAALAGEEEDIATDEQQAPAYMAEAVLGFNEQLERMLVVGVVLLLGGMLSARFLPAEALWFAPVLFFGIRPLATWIGLLGSNVGRVQRLGIAWFGIRGIGSIYYLMYAVEHGLPEPLAVTLTGITFSVVAASILLHGISVTPLMAAYSHSDEARAEEAEADGADAPGDRTPGNGPTGPTPDAVEGQGVRT